VVLAALQLPLHGHKNSCADKDQAQISSQTGKLDVIRGRKAMGP
jgi:hypothetical protein